ncbi:MAG: phytoene desaturase family protein, partial [Planctomycetota bacterium]
MTTKRIGIIGAGPGGLTSAVLLAHRGYEVHVFEDKDRVGGRNAPLHLGDYTFDTGPTFLMMKFILESVFENTGRNVDDYLNLTQLDPLYRLQIGDVEFFPSADLEKTRERIAETFSGNEEGLDVFLEKEHTRFDSLIPCLKRDYSSWTDFLSPTLLSALPRMSLGRSIFSNLGRYFNDDDLKLCFSFQSKYLGMSPWTYPAFFTMLSYIEHAYGIYHVEGGLNQISRAMTDVVREEGGSVHLETTIEEMIVEDGCAVGLRTEAGDEEHFDGVVINADFGHAMQNLIPQGNLRKYTPQKLSKWQLSCSTFMLYLGVDQEYPDLPHHNIIFADDYENNVN